MGENSPLVSQVSKHLRSRSNEGFCLDCLFTDVCTIANSLGS